MKNFKEIGRKIGLTVAAGGIAFGSIFGTERAGAQEGSEGDTEPSPAPLAQAVSPEDLGKLDNIVGIEDRGEVPPVGEGELGVGERFYLNSIEQEVTVMYVDRYMRLLMPDKMGGNPRYYLQIETIKINTEHTPDSLKENIWDVYWPQVYFDLIQNGKLTQDGKSYADVLGVQGNVSTETILQALRKLDGRWPLIPYRYKWGSNGQEDLYAEGYANPNLPINVIPLPRNLTPPAFGNEVVKPWIRIDSYQANTVVPNSAVGVLVNQETGQINIYTGFMSDSTGLGMLLYRVETVFTTNDGVRPTPKGPSEAWYSQWWESYLKGLPRVFSVS